MRFFVQIAVAILTVCLSISLAAAQNKVVIIPLNSAKELKNVVTVSAKGGDFTDPVAAVNSITDATETNPYLVLIGPGVYTLIQPLLMKPYVTIAGSGRDATILTGAISSGTLDSTSTLVSGADNATLSNLTIKNTGGNTFSIALYNNDSSPVIENVVAQASGGLGSVGVYNTNSSFPSMSHVYLAALDGAEYCALFNASSTTTIRDSFIFGLGGVGMCGPDSGFVYVRHSSIIGGLASTGTYHCLYSDNGVSTQLDPDCTMP